jgi:hypothetical protein
MKRIAFFIEIVALILYWLYINKIYNNDAVEYKHIFLQLIL